jgi:peptidoglycan-N-acetylglucosamine deacetylase
VRAVRRPSRSSLLAPAGAVLVAVLAGCGHGTASEIISITVAGKHEQVPPGTTLAQAAARFRLKPDAGSLVDITGRALRRGIYPGSLLVDGRPAPPSRRLLGGDRIGVVAGRDRTEAVRRELVPVKGGAVGDPQFTLSRTPGVDVVVRGAVSHKLVSAQFRPSSPQPKVEQAVALTFDDGPSPTDTPRILRVLKRFHVHATFFTIGYLAAAYPNLVSLEVHEGMTVGNHSYNHPQVPPFGELPQRLMRDEIELGAKSLAAGGVQPHLFRPPGGSYSPALVGTAKALGERIVLWSVDPSDWSPGVTGAQVASRVLAAVHPGSIVVLHDGGGDRTATVKALPAIIKGIRKRGLHLVALADDPPDLTAR